MRKSIIAAAAAATALVTGGAAGAALAGPSPANAQATPSTQAPSTQAPSTQAPTPGAPTPGAPTPGAPTPGAPTPGAPAAPRHEGGRNEAVSDLSIAAKAIGIPEADISTALASGQSLAAVAKAHSVDPQKVIDALVADARSELAAAVSGGKVTQAEADKETSSLTQRITDQVNAVGRHGLGRGGPHKGFGGGAGGGRAEAVSDLSIAAKAIGVPEADLTTAVGSGQSLAAVAKAHSVDPQKVIDALVADARSELAAAVSGGKLTQAQADQAGANLTQRMTDRVNEVGGHHGG